MQKDVVEQVLNHPKYAALVKRRTRASMIFFSLTLVIYAGCILTMVYLPDVFALPLGPARTRSVGLCLGLLTACSDDIRIVRCLYFLHTCFPLLLSGRV